MLGSASGGEKTVQPAPRGISRTVVVLLRFQIAVVYMFASIWKMTPDWWNGYCVQSIFLSFEDQGVARGVPWRYLLDRFPWIFMLVAFGGVFLDSLMFISLTFFRPSKAGGNAHRSTMPPYHRATVLPPPCMCARVLPGTTCSNPFSVLSSLDALQF